MSTFRHPDYGFLFSVQVASNWNTTPTSLPRGCARLAAAHDTARGMNHEGHKEHEPVLQERPHTKGRAPRLINVIRAATNPPRRLS